MSEVILSIKKKIDPFEHVTSYFLLSDLLGKRFLKALAIMREKNYTLMRHFCVKTPWDEGVKKIIEECIRLETCREKTILTPHRERLI